MPYCLAINVSTSITVKRKQTSQLLVSVEQALLIESLTDALSSTGCNGLLSGGCRQLKRLPGMTVVGIETLGIETLGIEMLGIQTERGASARTATMVALGGGHLHRTGFAPRRETGLKSEDRRS